MTDQERLENIKWFNATRPLTHQEGTWLIEKAEIKIQQDNIVNALVGEETLHQQGLLKPEIMRLQEENKRLREALQQISNSDIWFDNEDLTDYDGWLQCTKIADKALEG